MEDKHLIPFQDQCSNWNEVKDIIQSRVKQGFNYFEVTTTPFLDQDKRITIYSTTSFEILASRDPDSIYRNNSKIKQLQEEIILLRKVLKEVL